LLPCFVGALECEQFFRLGIPVVGQPAEHLFERLNILRMLAQHRIETFL